jgi:crotonobetainyl-CoA:carnitine CoA-transferase CaiB-like acyl-CoA transferase
MLLDAYRVLDLTDHRGQFCGKILADLGADVIKVEPPEGDPARKTGPFIDDDPDPGKSLYWAAYNTPRRHLDLQKDGGTVSKLAGKAKLS